MMLISSGQKALCKAENKLKVFNTTALNAELVLPLPPMCTGWLAQGPLWFYYVLMKLQSCSGKGLLQS